MDDLKEQEAKKLWRKVFDNEIGRRVRIAYPFAPSFPKKGEMGIIVEKSSEERPCYLIEHQGRKTWLLKNYFELIQERRMNGK